MVANKRCTLSPDTRGLNREEFVGMARVGKSSI